MAATLSAGSITELTSFSRVASDSLLGPENTPAFASFLAAHEDAKKGLDSFAEGERERDRFGDQQIHRLFCSF